MSLPTVDLQAVELMRAMVERKQLCDRSAAHLGVLPERGSATPSLPRPLTGTEGARGGDTPDGRCASCVH